MLVLVMMLSDWVKILLRSHVTVPLVVSATSTEDGFVRPQHYARTNGKRLFVLHTLMNYSQKSHRCPTSVGKYAVRVANDMHGVHTLPVFSILLNLEQQVRQLLKIPQNIMGTVV